MSYPIMVTTADSSVKIFNPDRYLYFVKTINSLEKTNADLNNMYIFDDHSEYQPKLKFLLTKSWHYYVNYRHENLGPTLNTIKGIDYLYTLYPQAEYIIFIQDDVIFSKNWLVKGIQILRQIDYDIKYNTGQYTMIGDYAQIKKIGILSLYNRTGPSKNQYYLMPDGHPGGVAWIIKTRFWTDYRKNFGINDNIDELIPLNERNNHKKQSQRNLIDYKLCHRAHSIGWDCARVGKSLVQHIGDWSSLAKRNMAEHRSKNFVGEE